MTISPIYTTWCDALPHSPGCPEHIGDADTRTESWKLARTYRWVRYQTRGTGYAHYSPQCDPFPGPR